MNTNKQSRDQQLAFREIALWENTLLVVWHKETEQQPWCVSSAVIFSLCASSVTPPTNSDPSSLSDTADRLQVAFKLLFFSKTVNTERAQAVK